MHVSHFSREEWRLKIYLAYVNTSTVLLYISFLSVFELAFPWPGTLLPLSLSTLLGCLCSSFKFQGKRHFFWDVVLEYDFLNSSHELLSSGCSSYHMLITLSLFSPRDCRASHVSKLYSLHLDLLLSLFSDSVVSDTLQPHGLQHSRLPCPSLSSWGLLKFMSTESVMLKAWKHLLNEWGCQLVPRKISVNV